MTAFGEHQPRTYYHLGEGHKVLVEATGTTWPYFVDYSPDHPYGAWILAEGVGHGAAGGHFTPAEILTPQWREHLEITGTLWLIPIWERIAQGETVATNEVLAAYTHVHGKPPEKAVY